MHAAGADGFGQAVVGIVLVVREYFHPAMNEAGRHGLGANVHQSPLRQFIFLKIDLAGIDGVQQILRPGNQQPNDGAAFFRDGAQNPFRLHSAQQYCLAARHKRTEPVHFCACVIQGRDAQKYVVVRLAVVVLLHLTGAQERAVIVQNGLGEARSAGGEIDSGVIVFLHFNGRGIGGAVAHQLQAVLGVIGSVLAYEKEHAHLRNLLCDQIHTRDKLRAEGENLHIRQLQTIFDFIAGIAEVERHGNAPGFEHAKINRQPLQTVHQKDAYLCAALHAAAEQKIGKAIGTAIKTQPGDFSAQRSVGCAFNQAIFTPGFGVIVRIGRAEFHQRGFLPVITCIAFQIIGNQHIVVSFAVVCNKK